MDDPEMNLPARPAEQTLGPAEKLVRDYVSQAKAANTLRAYAADWRHFTAWCRGEYWGIAST